VNADVVVVGSGAGALISAAAAAARGADVIVLEKSGQLGGGSALSTGLLFAPNNRQMAEAGIADSDEDAFRYLRALNGGLVSEDRLRGFLARLGAMLEFVELETPMQLHAVPHLPDFHPEFDGGRLGGRHLAAEPFEGSRLGEWAERTRRSQSLPLSYHEIEQMGGPAKVRSWDFGLIAERIPADIRAQGAALVAPLVAACLERGVQIHVNAAVRRLSVADDRVVGVEVDLPDGLTSIAAHRGVILGTGGFEWNAEMNRRFLPAPMAGPLTVPTNEGDGHRMGIRIGAAVAMMHESVWAPVLQVPGEEYEGKPYWRNLASEKGRPHSLIVNRDGRRFANESLNYVDFGRALTTYDATSPGFPNVEAFLILDAAYKSTYPVATAMPGESAPDWMAESNTLDDLAGQLGINPGGLRNTVARFNAGAAVGVDEEFNRGSTEFERYYGDPETAGPNPALGPIDQPPFYGVRVQLGTFGNRGGMLGDDVGRVLDVDGQTIPGLYACGNVLAQVALGRGYEGGATLAQAMTYGHAAAMAATSER
jgi:succinate dehydrogenase/fumarate reductase flavoprotein subunit